MDEGAIAYSKREPGRSSERGLMYQAFSVVLLAVALFAAVYACFPTAMSRLSAPPRVMEIQPSPAFTCKARKGDVVLAAFTVKNIAPQPIKLLGAKSGCSCTIAEGLPLKLGSGESGKVKLRLTVGTFDRTGMFEKSAELLTTSQGIVPPLVIQVLSLDVPTSH